MEGLDQVSEEFSFDKEKEIARSFSKRFQWEMMLIGSRTGNYMAVFMAVSY